MLTDEASHDYLHFVIGEKDLLVRASEIREIIRPLSLAMVPMGPKHLLGLTNIRGQIVCIIDVGKLTGLSSGDMEVTNRTRFMVLRHALMHVGMQVDEVRELQHIHDQDIQFEAGQEPHATGISRVEIDGQAYGLLRCIELLPRIQY